MYINKPHVGTDVLSGIVRNMREDIKRLGGEVHFDSLFTGYDQITQDEVCVHIKNLSDGSEKEYRTNALFWHLDTAQGILWRCFTKKVFRWSQSHLPWDFVSNTSEQI